jgi:Protein of unknown function (DUF1404)
LHPARRSAEAATSGGWLSGPLLLLIAVSPPVTGLSAQSLVIHHFAHWLLVVAGAIIGYQLRDRVNLPGRAPAAWVGLGTTIVWHFPPVLALTEASLLVHMLAHASLVAGGIAVGWGVPKLGGGSKASLLIAANVVMWPVVLFELAGAFNYPGYPGQAAAAGVAEMVAMSLAWLVLALWMPLRTMVGRPAVSVTLQAALVGLLVLDWMAR